MLLCLIPYSITRKANDPESGEDAPKLVFVGACILDWLASTCVNAAFLVLHASHIEMMRGASLIFTFLFALGGVGRRQYGYHFLGFFLILLGTSLVSLSAIINPFHEGAVPAAEAPTLAILTGIMVCIAGQMFEAVHCVYEAEVMGIYKVPPVLLVGMQGLYGIFFATVVLVVVNLMQVEITSVALHQLQKSDVLLIALIISIFAVAVVNFAGVTVAQKAGAVARCTIVMSRSILVWGVELALGWAVFNELQLIGFIVLASGTMIYNRILVLPLQMLDPPKEAEALIDETNEGTRGRKQQRRRRDG